MGTKRDKSTGRKDTLGREIKVSSTVSQPASSVDIGSYSADIDTVDPHDTQQYYDLLIHEEAIQRVSQKYGITHSDYLPVNTHGNEILQEYYDHEVFSLRLETARKRLQDKIGCSKEEVTYSVYNPTGSRRPVLSSYHPLQKTVMFYDGDSQEVTPTDFLIGYTEDYLNGFHHGDEPIVSLSTVSLTHHDTPQNMTSIIEDVIRNANESADSLEFSCTPSPDGDTLCIETDFTQGLSTLEDPDSKDFQTFRLVKNTLEDQILAAQYKKK